MSSLSRVQSVILLLAALGALAAVCDQSLERQHPAPLAIAPAPTDWAIHTDCDDWSTWTSTPTLETAQGTHDAFEHKRTITIQPEQPSTPP